MSLSERIRTAMEAAGVSQAALARACGVKPPSIHGWLSGKSKFLRGENLLLAARALNVSEEWLATGKGEMMPGSTPAQKAPLSDSPFFDQTPEDDDAHPVRVGPVSKSVPIPIVKIRLRAGVSGYSEEPDPQDDDNGVLAVPQDVIAALGADIKDLMVIRVKGRSMETMLFEDDQALVNKARRAPLNKGIFAINWNGEAVVKMLLKKGSDWYMHSMNPDPEFGDINVRSGQASIVGQVVWQPGRFLTGRT